LGGEIFFSEIDKVKVVWLSANSFPSLKVSVYIKYEQTFILEYCIHEGKGKNSWERYTKSVRVVWEYLRDRSGANFIRSHVPDAICALKKYNSFIFKSKFESLKENVDKTDFSFSVLRQSHLFTSKTMRFP
jgi:hypothetical protein